jgi:hypothetical protein
LSSDIRCFLFSPYNLNSSKLIRYLCSTPNVFPKLRALALTRAQNSAALFSNLNFSNSEVIMFTLCSRKEGADKTWQTCEHVTFSLHLSFSILSPTHEYLLLSSVNVVCVCTVLYIPVCVIYVGLCYIYRSVQYMSVCAIYIGLCNICQSVLYMSVCAI